jgi:hypothetical protein
MTENGLLPQVGEDELEWLRPQLPAGSDRDEATEALVHWIMDIHQTLSVVWPAVLDGRRRPPDAHLLDGLVRRAIVDNSDDHDLIAEASLHPRAVTIAVMPGELPDCTICEESGPTTVARYDSGYTPVDRGPWTYLCEEHFDELGPGRLGNGIGQYLITWDEVGPDVRAAFVHAREYWAARGVPLTDFLQWDD